MDLVRTDARMSRGVVAAQTAVTNISRSGNIRVRNQELYFGNSNLIGNATAPNQVRLGAVVSPSAIGTWITNVAGNYSKYRIHSITYEYIPIVGTTASGTFAMGFFTDPSDGNNYNSSTVGSALARLSACTKFSCGPLYTAQKITIKAEDMNFGSQFLPYDSSLGILTPEELARTTCKGAVGFYIQYDQATNPGNVFVTYDIEVMDPVSAILQS